VLYFFLSFRGDTQSTFNLAGPCAGAQAFHTTSDSQCLQPVRKPVICRPLPPSASRQRSTANHPIRFSPYPPAQAAQAFAAPELLSAFTDAMRGTASRLKAGAVLAVIPRSAVAFPQVRSCLLVLWSRGIVVY
jgi:hypothetical protein